MRWPAWLNLRRLEGRIVALFLALLLVVQLISFGAIHASITHNAEDSLAAELQTGERVLRRLLDQRAGKLRDAAELLAKDYGFRSTVGLSLAEAGTVETIKDALVNQGERVGASDVAYFDEQQHLVAATRDGAAAFGAALGQLVRSKDGAALAVQGNRVYQVVAVQVRTPAPVGWVLMAFALDREVLDDLKALSELQGVVLLQTPNQPWLGTVSNLDGNATAALPARLGREAPVDGVFELAGERMRARFVSLLDGEQHLGVLLLRSLDAALAPYQQLQLILLGLTVLGVAIFALVSVLLARGISNPITALSASARRLEGGDYDTPVPATARLEEVHKLALALESMREGIRRRDALVNNLAYVDQLTLLPNRARFAEFLQHHLANSDTPGAVLMLDLDRFKHVNDVLGHDVGDRLLQSVAERLQALCAPAHSVLARLSGDEFAILLAHTDAHAASEAALAILKDFERPLQIDNETIDLGAGIGIALFPEHGHDVNLLLGRAELAMYAAKSRQCGSLIYHAQLDAGSQESLSLLTELRHAVEDNELRLFLQPKIDLQKGHVVGAEALVRWQHPTRGLVPPMQFIPFAEQTGFIRMLSAWVLSGAARFAREAADAGLALRLSVNLSTRDLMDQDLPAKIEAMLTPLQVAPASLCLEITESAIMDDPERALSTLEHLHAMGFKLSIDDFGTGYSSLAYLKRLPVDELKIDKSFVMAMERDLDDARIVRSTIELAHNLGLSVVAEGLETVKAWAMLAHLGCDEGQGYYIGKPMPQEQFIAWAKSWQPPDTSAVTTESVIAKLG
ncbi:diguanylate cyclase (GGDEF)-like protein [Pelomonas saccharophila]|uniref:Diguanylate cyclase (GGDEF)-like protein n=1 Tax=Roseateles saccharophilus TaxID=304 RepID=A0ABU1YNK0_ROSSA|nr:EAL domain-containing protein [Roseateles saccharophilus]MDR7269781.1 diguanylate cyclase (GGDEF)-like protein [Roseateles saccharophilus]